MSPLKELAKSRGWTLSRMGIPSIRLVAAGYRHAGPEMVVRIAATLGVSEVEAQTACDAAWQAKQRPTSPDASAVDPSANGAQVVHAADYSPALAP
jgi:hypothetical protein